MDVQDLSFSCADWNLPKLGITLLKGTILKKVREDVYQVAYGKHKDLQVVVQNWGDVPHLINLGDDIPLTLLLGGILGEIKRRKRHLKRRETVLIEASLHAGHGYAFGLHRPLLGRPYLLCGWDVLVEWVAEDAAIALVTYCCEDLGLRVKYE